MDLEGPVDLAAVFLLALLGGYYFALIWRYTAFSTRRIDGHHLYFRSALFGFISFLIALLFRLELLPAIHGYKEFETAVLNYIAPVLSTAKSSQTEDGRHPAEFLLTAAYSLVAGPFCGLLLNYLTPTRWAQIRSLGTLNRLLLQSQDEGMPVQLTLDSGKVYIGMVASITDPDKEADFITVVPMYSGHRDERNQMRLTTDYEAVYNALRAGRAKDLGLPGDWLSQFALAIKADTIISATKFSLATYSMFNPDWRNSITASHPTSHGSVSGGSTPRGKGSALR
jgi:hypothetical protein